MASSRSSRRTAAAFSRARWICARCYNPLSRGEGRGEGAVRHLYRSGLSHEDERTEATALALDSRDRVLTVAGAGDMPLALPVIDPH